MKNPSLNKIMKEMGKKKRKPSSGKDIIIDPMGQWRNPGKPVIVPTPTGEITMQGVPYPVYGEDETGYGQMMYPGQDYTFPGTQVYEQPLIKAQGGKFLYPPMTKCPEGYFLLPDGSCGTSQELAGAIVGRNGLEKNYSYEPSDNVKKSKAFLAGASLATAEFPIVQYAAQLAGVGGDLYTAGRYALDQNWEKAREDALQAGIGLIPYAKAYQGLKGAAYFTKPAWIYNNILRAANAGNDVKTISEDDEVVNPKNPKKKTISNNKEISENKPYPHGIGAYGKPYIVEGEGYPSGKGGYGSKYQVQKKHGGWLDRHQGGGDISIPDLQQGVFLDKYGPGGQAVLNKFYKNLFGNINKRAGDGNVSFMDRALGSLETVFENPGNALKFLFTKKRRITDLGELESNPHDVQFFSNTKGNRTKTWMPHFTADFNPNTKRTTAAGQPKKEFSYYTSEDLEREKQSNPHWYNWYDPSIPGGMQGGWHRKQFPSYRTAQDYFQRSHKGKVYGPNVSFIPIREGEDLTEYYNGGQLQKFKPGGATDKKQCPNGQMLLPNGQCGTYADLQRMMAASTWNNIQKSNQMVWQSNAAPAAQPAAQTKTTQPKSNKVKVPYNINQQDVVRRGDIGTQTGTGSDVLLKKEVARQSIANKEYETGVGALMSSGMSKEQAERQYANYKKNPTVYKNTQKIIEDYEGRNYRIKNHPDYDPGKSFDEQAGLASDNSIRARLLRGSNMLTNTGNTGLDLVTGLVTAPGRAFANLTTNAEQQYFNPNNSFLQNATNLAFDVADVIPLPVAQGIGALGRGTRNIVKQTGRVLNNIPGFNSSTNFVSGFIPDQKLFQNNELYRGLVNSTNTITDEGLKIIDDISSEEGVRRLRNQFATADPTLNSDQLDYLVANRINEARTAVTHNKPKFFLEHGMGALGTPTQATNIEHWFPQNNAHWTGYNPHPNVTKFEAPKDLFSPQARPTGQGVQFQNQVEQAYGPFVSSEYNPGTITLGSGLEKNVGVLDHEIGHAIQKGGAMPIDYQLTSLLQPKNAFDRAFDKLFVKPGTESWGDKLYFTGAGGRQFKNEAYPFLVEQRRNMMNSGILKDRYDKVTPWKLFQARLNADKAVGRNYMEGNRLIKFTPFWKYGQLSKIMNNAPAISGTAAGGFGLNYALNSSSDDQGSGYQQKNGGRISSSFETLQKNGLLNLNNETMKNYFSGGLVDYLAQKGMAFDKATRAKMAKERGIENYDFSAEKNTQLLNSLIKEFGDIKDQPTGNTKNTGSKGSGKKGSSTTAAYDIPKRFYDLRAVKYHFPLQFDGYINHLKSKGLTDKQVLDWFNGEMSINPHLFDDAPKNIKSGYGNVQKQMQEARHNALMKNRKLESGTVVDKGTNTMYIIKDNKVIKEAPVLTGAAGKNHKTDPNQNPYSVAFLENNPQLRSTPTGTYFMNPSANIYGWPGFNLDPISAFGQGAPNAANTAMHITYGARPLPGMAGHADPGEFARRNAAYSQPGSNRYMSFGCTNMQGETVDCMQQNFPKGDTAIYIDSRNPADVPFLNYTKRNRKKLGGTTYSGGVWYKEGGTPCYECGGTYQDGNQVPDIVSAMDLVRSFGAPITDYYTPFTNRKRRNPMMTQSMYMMDGGDIPNYMQDPNPMYNFGGYFPQAPRFQNGAVVADYAEPTQGNITELLDVMGVDPSYANRVEIAKRLNIPKYSGTAAQNIQMFNMLYNNDQLANQLPQSFIKKGVKKYQIGNVVAPSRDNTYLNNFVNNIQNQANLKLLNQFAPQYTMGPDGRVSMVKQPEIIADYAGWNNGDLLELLSVVDGDNSYTHRKKVAKELGIKNYRGTKDQNIQMYNILNNKYKFAMGGLAKYQEDGLVRTEMGDEEGEPGPSNPMPMPLFLANPNPLVNNPNLGNNSYLRTGILSGDFVFSGPKEKSTSLNLKGDYNLRNKGFSYGANLSIPVRRGAFTLGVDHENRPAVNPGGGMMSMRNSNTPASNRTTGFSAGYNGMIGGPKRGIKVKANVRYNANNQPVRGGRPAGDEEMQTGGMFMPYPSFNNYIPSLSEMRYGGRQTGGIVEGQILEDVTPDMLEKLQAGGYTFEIVND